MSLDDFFDIVLCWFTVDKTMLDRIRIKRRLSCVNNFVSFDFTEEKLAK